MKHIDTNKVRESRKVFGIVKSILTIIAILILAITIFVLVYEKIKNYEEQEATEIIQQRNVVDRRCSGTIIIEAKPRSLDFRQIIFTPIKSQCDFEIKWKGGIDIQFGDPRDRDGKEFRGMTQEVFKCLPGTENLKPSIRARSMTDYLILVDLIYTPLGTLSRGVGCQ